jgi:hypothetical protein
MTTESQQYNCFTRNGGNAIPKHASPQAKGSNPTTRLTLLWARNPFGEILTSGKSHRKKAGQIFFQSFHIFKKWKLTFPNYSNKKNLKYLTYICNTLLTTGHFLIYRFLRFSPRCDTNVDSSGNFPGVWVLSSDVSVTSVGSIIFRGGTATRRKKKLRHCGNSQKNLH